MKINTAKYNKNGLLTPFLYNYMGIVVNDEYVEKQYYYKQTEVLDENHVNRFTYFNENGDVVAYQDVNYDNESNYTFTELGKKLLLEEAKQYFDKELTYRVNTYKI